MASRESTSHLITALILSGGKGERMLCRDKGLILYKGKPLIEHLISIIKPQVANILLNCNRNFEDYRRYKLPLVRDSVQDYAGPLRGILSCRENITTPYTLIVPCDMPNLPVNLVTKLMPIEKDIEINCCHDGTRQQSLVFIMKTETIKTIESHLKEGDYSVKSWLSSRKVKNILFNQTSAQGEIFANINTPDLTDPA